MSGATHRLPTMKITPDQLDAITNAAAIVRALALGLRGIEIPDQADADALEKLANDALRLLDGTASELAATEDA
jgi:hypothetical protein